jgi:hypothetical protein
LTVQLQFLHLTTHATGNAGFTRIAVNHDGRTTTKVTIARKFP